MWSNIIHWAFFWNIELPSSFFFFFPAPPLLHQSIRVGLLCSCSRQGPSPLLGTRTSAGRGAKCWAVGLVGRITLVIKREAIWGQVETRSSRGRLGRTEAAGPAPARGPSAPRRRASPRGGSPGGGPRSGRARGPSAPPGPPSRQPLTSNLSLSRLKGGRGKGRLPLRLFRAWMQSGPSWPAASLRGSKSTRHPTVYTARPQCSLEAPYWGGPACKRAGH